MVDKSPVAAPPAPPTVQQLAAARVELAKVKAQKAALTKETGLLSKQHAELEKRLITEAGKLKKLKARKIGAFIGLNTKERELHHEVLRLSEKVHADMVKRLAVNAS